MAMLVRVVALGAVVGLGCGRGSAGGGSEDDATGSTGSTSDGGGTSTDSGTGTMCGNGQVEVGEECDDGGENEACDANCTWAACGDGDLNTSRGEDCDDGNDVQGDGCNNDCVPSGTELWTRTFTGLAEGRGIATDGADNVLVVGETIEERVGNIGALFDRHARHILWLT
jgi:cysteine-rich repeat protein